MTGLPVGTDTDYTLAVALGDVDNDGDLDVVAGNFLGYSTKLHLNQGGANPFPDPGLSLGTLDAITSDVALGDIDGDGLLDLVTARDGVTNQLFLNNGTAQPFTNVTPKSIGTQTEFSAAIALGDVNRDGHLDVVFGNTVGQNRVHLNNGGADPFQGVPGTQISGDPLQTRDLSLHDIDRDGDLDLVTGNFGAPNEAYLNNGTAAPFDDATVATIPLRAISQNTTSIALADVDGDGDLDVWAGNNNASNLLTLNTSYALTAGTIVSGPMLPPQDFDARIYFASLFASTPSPLDPESTAVELYLSNDGGNRWWQVAENQLFNFPTPGNDLRWRAVLRSSSPRNSPEISYVTLEFGLDTDGDELIDDCDAACVAAGYSEDPDDDNDGVGDTLDLAPLDASIGGLGFDQQSPETPGSEGNPYLDSSLADLSGLSSATGTASRFTCA